MTSHHSNTRHSLFEAHFAFSSLIKIITQLQLARRKDFGRHDGISGWIESFIE